MRPRHKAAENEYPRSSAGDRQVPASMRPRHKAAENDAGIAKDRDDVNELQ